MPLGLSHTYILEYWKDGELIWTEEMHNLIPTEGLNAYLDRALVTGVSSPVEYIGLKGSGTPNASDTMASHASWSEITVYSASNRPAWTPGSISAGSVNNSASKAVFTMTSNVDVYGLFLTTNNTKGGATGILLGVGDFSTSKSMEIDGELRLTVTCTATSA